MSNMEEFYSAGNYDDKTRSDCRVAIALKNEGGIQLEVISKVNVLYGDSIRALCLEILSFFQIEHAILKVEDKGALSWVIAARIEAAIKQAISTDKNFLPEFIEENKYSTAFDRNRFSRLYLPGNTPSLMINAGVHQPYAIILDLEDAVAPHKKFEAKFLVRNALRSLDFMGAERMVRINQLPLGLDDLDFIVPHQVHVILVPKCECAQQLKDINERIEAIQKKHNVKQDIWLMPIIESALGVMHVLEIAQAANNVVAIAIGLEDYTADLGVQRSLDGKESLFARSVIVNACKAVGIQPIDSVFSDVADLEGLKQNVLQSKALGFEGMGCIHPRQIKVIHENFAPNESEIEKAKVIVNAFEDALAKGVGVVSVGTKMIDAPVVKRAQKILALAIAMNKLSADWRSE
jgi:citrate lyase subunit beta/citryl-CoA lyase